MSNLSFEIISLFPKSFDVLNHIGVISRAIENKLISIKVHDLRSYGIGSYKKVDDIPYGGGSGMLLKPEPIYKAHDSIKKSKESLTLLMTPQGKVLKQKDCLKWSKYKQVILICGQYEGFDERVREIADEEVSVGDYILTGGEIPAMVIVNALSRLLPGVLGDPDSLIDESHNKNLLEYPQYTRPRIFRGMEVPDVLISGNHKKIKEWHDEQMFKRTYERRIDLLKTANLDHPSGNSFKNKKLDELENMEDDWFWDVY